MNPPSIREIVEVLRTRAGVPVTQLGPLVGMSPAWGQRVLDGTVCPLLSTADRIARALCARESERLVLLEAVSRVKLEHVGITGADLDRVVEVLLLVYRERRGS